LSVICGDGNCSRRATVRLGIDTLIANILVKHTPSEASEYVSENRYTWLPLLCLTPPAEGFPWDDLCEIFSECQRMAKVPNAAEILPKI